MRLLRPIVFYAKRFYYTLVHCKIFITILSYNSGRGNPVKLVYKDLSHVTVLYMFLRSENFFL